MVDFRALVRVKLCGQTDRCADRQRMWTIVISVVAVWWMSIHYMLWRHKHVDVNTQLIGDDLANTERQDTNTTIQPYDK